MLCDHAAAADYLVIRMRREHEQALAPQPYRLERDRVRLDSHSAPDYRGRYHGRVPRVSTSESSVGSEDHARISDVVTLIQELTSRGIGSESTAGLFAGAFATLFRCVAFDVAVAVMIEQNLDFYISTRAGEEALVDDALIARIRTALESRLPISFATTDVVVKSESHALAPRGAGAARCHTADS